MCSKVNMANDGGQAAEEGEFARVGLRMTMNRRRHHKILRFHECDLSCPESMYDSSAMADDPFYAPNRTPPPPRMPRASEPLWAVRSNGATWEPELRYHSEYGVEAQLFKQGELVIGRRFDKRELAVQWAEMERKAIERDA